MLGTNDNSDNDQELGDSRVRILLDQLKLSYQIDDNKDFVIAFGIKEDALSDDDETRTQIAIISSDTHHIGDFEVRHIFSIGYEAIGELPRNVANALLIMNDNVKLGAWKAIHVKKDGQDGMVAAFQAQVAADTDAQSLFTTLMAVCATADDVENKLTGEDRF